VAEGVHITAAAQQLGVSAQHLRQLERQQRVPPARRDTFGARCYTQFDIELLRALGVGSKRRLRRPEELLELAR
jgi:DNA-binding transcriptional MerR regulator